MREDTGGPGTHPWSEVAAPEGETSAASGGLPSDVFDFALHHLPLYATLAGAAGSLVVWTWARRVLHRQDAAERREAIADQARRVEGRAYRVVAPEASGEVPGHAPAERVRVR